MATSKKKTEESGPKKILFAMQPELSDQMGYILWKEGDKLNQTTFLNEAAKLFIEQWEKKNGKIPKR